jgi:hypothetical protein
MRTYFVTFRSVTYAQRGESVLQKAGIGCKLQRTPRWMEAQGCGYCLRLSLKEAAQAVELLRQKQVPMRKIYLQMEDGDVQEVQM